MPQASPKNIFIAGAGLRGEGYPNAWNTIELIRSANLAQVTDCSYWLPSNLTLWKLSTAPPHKAISVISRILICNLASCVKLLARSPKPGITYIPYPGVVTLWLLSWLPKGIRPRCICDAYITIWDSLYQDRGLGNSKGLVCRMLLMIESRALRAAELIISDTEANADHVSSTFRVPRERILSIPLALHPQPEGLPLIPIHRKKVKVLFIGTFVPLQGTTVIAKAIHALRNETDIEFVIIGDGQESNAAAPWLYANDSVTWIRTWQSPDALAEQLSQADICLGIFGGDGKASRVLPFKIYQALAAGKAVISQGKFSLPLGTPQPPMIHSLADPEELAKAIRSLASSTERRLQLGHDASQYFQRFLSNSSLTRRWRQLIENLR